MPVDTVINVTYQTTLFGYSDPFVKLVLCYGDRIIKAKKTSVKKGTIDPVFNESLSFNVTSEQLEQSSLLVIIITLLS